MRTGRLILFLTVFLMFVSVTAAYAAPAEHLVQEFDLVADRYVNPMDASFFEEAGTGRLEFYNLKNLYGSGAQMIVYVNTEGGRDWLVFSFSGDMLEVKLQNRHFTLLVERVSAVTKTSPLTVKVRDGKLTVSIGAKARTVSEVNSFTGSLTTQSITGKYKVYQFDE
ncbi:MAG: hypothetical protein P4N41_05390 [Negativicutes bacterium]|nr:hypothetical protein [Negativicutes bacterium]